MNPARIIAITGLRRSGKDEIASFLGTKHGYENIKVADSLKSVVKTMFNMTDAHVEGDLKDIVDNRWDISPRQVMQFIGTEVMQYKIQELLPNIGRKFWIRQLCDRIAASPNTCFAISDVRFLHEVDELKTQFPGQVFVVKIVRPAFFEANLCNHASELEWQCIMDDAFINNDGTIADLHSKIECIFSRMK